MSEDAGKPAAAVGVLLEATTRGPEITPELVWDTIEAVVRPPLASDDEEPVTAPHYRRRGADCSPRCT